MIRIGASSWTAPGWQNVFYPPKTAGRDQISFYATRYDTVEIDATFYAIPSRSTVIGWKNRTPAGFVFAAKVPQVITHEKLLENCASEIDQFCENISLLEEKLGPILFQFRYFRKNEWQLEQFVQRLEPVLDRVPSHIKCVVEVRNKTWLNPGLIKPLRARNAALALIAHPYMPFASEYERRLDELLTADFAYLRFLGDRAKVEELIAKMHGEVSFERTVLDRTNELSAWAHVVQKLQEKKISVYAYFNNHYSGYAPADIERFRQLVADLS